MSKERGFRPPTEESFAQDVGPEGALYVGSPETVAEKIVANLAQLDASRFDLKFGMPGLTHDQIMTTIELYGTQVIPRVRERIGNGGAPKHPDWYHNLVANPDAKAEIGTETFVARARVAEAEERSELLRRIVARTPSVSAAINRTFREIPVVILDLPFSRGTPQSG